MNKNRRTIETFLATIGILALIIACSCGGLILWVRSDTGREIGIFDLGGGRDLRIYSHGEPLDPHSVLFEIREGGRIVYGPQWIGSDHGQRFEFRTARSTDRTVQCVYEAGYATEAERFGMIVLYDAQSRECWHPNEVTKDPEVKRYWRDRYRRVCEANSSFPRHPWFDRLGVEPAP